LLSPILAIVAYKSLYTSLDTLLVIKLLK